jgi:methyl-accepting chemotaxis protein
MNEAVSQSSGDSLADSLADSLIGRIARAIAIEEERFRSRVADIVSEAINLSNTEVRAATGNLRGISQDAQEQVTNLRTLLSRAGDEREIAGEVLSQQSRYCKDAVGMLHQQSEVAQRSMLLGQSIAGFVETIGRISTAARILTINGQIESVRMGSQGAAFAVIANQMRDLSREVQRANQSISELAADLQELMPVLAGNAGGLLKMTESFSDAQAQQVSRFQGAVDEAQRNFEKALVETEERAGRIMERTDQIMVHLQFQDRMAQELGGVEDLARRNVAVLTELFARLSQDGITAQDVEAALEEAGKKVPNMDRRMGKQKSSKPVDVPASGMIVF